MADLLEGLRAALADHGPPWKRTESRVTCDNRCLYFSCQDYGAGTQRMCHIAAGD
jgi:hypothetical protein